MRELEYGALISLYGDDIGLFDVVDEVHFRVNCLKLVDLLYPRFNLLIFGDAAEQNRLFSVPLKDLL